MIWGWLADLLGVLVAPLRAVLPTITLFDAGEPTTAATSTGHYMAFANYLLPMAEAVGMLQILVNYVLPAVIAYTVGNWIWRHIPELWGFGPGAG